jgi:hypothetical protein
MSKRVQIKSTHSITEAEASQLLGIEDALKAVDSNRLRIRSLASMLLTACSMILSASFVTLFFLIKESLVAANSTVFILQLSGVLFLIMSIALSLSSALIPAPSLAVTKLSFLETQIAIYKRELRLARWAFISFLVGIILFLISLAVFAGWSLRAK